MIISYFHYVRLHDVPKWVATGWEETHALKGIHHGDYSELLLWKREGEPVYPEAEHG